MSSRAKGNLSKKKYVLKKHFVSEEENNSEEEINLTHSHKKRKDSLETRAVCKEIPLVS